MKINWTVRFKNPVFIGEIIMAVLTPILAFAGMTLKDVSSWKVLLDVLYDGLLNPYVLGVVAVSVWNAVNDPTTKGVWDSNGAMEYIEPK